MNKSDLLEHCICRLHRQNRADKFLMRYNNKNSCSSFQPTCLNFFGKTPLSITSNDSFACLDVSSSKDLYDHEYRISSLNDNLGYQKPNERQLIRAHKETETICVCNCYSKYLRLVKMTMKSMRKFWILGEKNLPFFSTAQSVLAHTYTRKQSPKVYCRHLLKN